MNGAVCKFRAEAYDFINHPNLSNPNFNPTSSQFGMFTSKTGLVRQLQLALRFYFLTGRNGRRRVKIPGPAHFSIRAGSGTLGDSNPPPP
jgi:hypothetical protein